MKQTRIAYWLLPAEPAREFFAGAICDLAGKLNAPVFEPHVTLFAAAEDTRAPDEVIRELGLIRLTLRAADVRASDKFTKSLFVQLETNEELRALLSNVSSLSGGSQLREIDPHLSLLYQRLPLATKRELAASIVLPFGEVSFDSIAAVRCASPTTTPHDVAQWKIVARGSR